MVEITPASGRSSAVTLAHRSHEVARLTRSIAVFESRRALAFAHRSLAFGASGERGSR
jgi:hypothetical protein